MKEAEPFLTDFYEENNISIPSELFEAQSDTFYFAKDREGRFVYANKILINHFGMKSLNDLLGRTDFDVLRLDLAEKYREDDIKIMTEKIVLRNKLELVGDGKGNVHWFLTTKAPLKNINGEIVGIEGLTRDVRRTENSIEPYSEFRGCIDYMQKNYMNSISIK